MLDACLVSLPAAPVVDSSIRGSIGGTETRAWLFARLLSELPDTKITFVVRHREPLPLPSASPKDGSPTSTDAAISSCG